MYPLPRIEAKALGVPRLAVDDAKVYSLAELVDFAERNNPETRAAWEGAKNRGAALHIAQSELSKRPRASRPGAAFPCSATSLGVKG